MLVGMAQTLPVLLGGIDLSVGSLMTLVELASPPRSCAVRPRRSRSGSRSASAPVFSAASSTGSSSSSAACSRSWSTLATGAIYIGIALFIRPTPGGKVDGDLGWVATNALGELPATFGWWNGSPPAWFDLIAGIPMPIVILVCRRRVSGCPTAIP